MKKNIMIKYKGKSNECVVKMKEILYLSKGLKKRRNMGGCLDEKSFNIRNI